MVYVLPVLLGDGDGVRFAPPGLAHSVTHAFYSDAADKARPELSPSEQAAPSSPSHRALEDDPEQGRGLPDADPRSKSYVVELLPETTGGHGVSVGYRYSQDLDAALIPRTRRCPRRTGPRPPWPRRVPCPCTSACFEEAENLRYLSRSALGDGLCRHAPDWNSRRSARRLLRQNRSSDRCNNRRYDDNGRGCASRGA
ncbi:hypothetical protein [Streptomyces sp. NPDC059063]|uniref:hypothetical protein n=1 Tax=Streptomyces sp. NPDC059063 TaxID=3346712 RepID=UPI0036C7065E